MIHLDKNGHTEEFYYCNDCKRETNHIAVKHHTTRRVYTVKEGLREEEFTGVIVKCEGCEYLSFVKNGFSETLNNGKAISTGTYSYRYPEENRNYREYKNIVNIPPDIANLYYDTVFCLNHNKLLFCAMGLRSLIEAICKDKMPNVSSKLFLDKRIDEMCAGRVLSKNHADTLHQLRFMGNVAVHELAIPERKEIETAINIVEHTIENLYGVIAEVSQKKSLK